MLVPRSRCAVASWRVEEATADTSAAAAAVAFGGCAPAVAPDGTAIIRFSNEAFLLSYPEWDGVGKGRPRAPGSDALPLSCALLDVGASSVPPPPPCIHPAACCDAGHHLLVHGGITADGTVTAGLFALPLRGAQRGHRREWMLLAPPAAPRSPQLFAHALIHLALYDVVVAVGGGALLSDAAATRIGSVNAGDDDDDDDDDGSLELDRLPLRTESGDALRQLSTNAAPNASIFAFSLAATSSLKSREEAATRGAWPHCLPRTASEGWAAMPTINSPFTSSAPHPARATSAEAIARGGCVVVAAAADTALLCATAPAGSEPPALRLHALDLHTLLWREIEAALPPPPPPPLQRGELKRTATSRRTPEVCDASVEPPRTTSPAAAPAIRLGSCGATGAIVACMWAQGGTSLRVVRSEPPQTAAALSFEVKCGTDALAEEPLQPQWRVSGDVDGDGGADATSSSASRRTSAATECPTTSARRARRHHHHHHRRRMTPQLLFEPLASAPSGSEVQLRLPASPPAPVVHDAVAVLRPGPSSGCGATNAALVVLFGGEAPFETHATRLATLPGGEPLALALIRAHIADARVRALPPSVACVEALAVELLPAEAGAEVRPIPARCWSAHVGGAADADADAGAGSRTPTASRRWLGSAPQPQASQGDVVALFDAAAAVAGGSAFRAGRHAPRAALRQQHVHLPGGDMDAVAARLAALATRDSAAARHRLAQLYGDGGSGGALQQPRAGAPRQPLHLSPGAAAGGGGGGRRQRRRPNWDLYYGTAARGPAAAAATTTTTAARMVAAARRAAAQSHGSAADGPPPACDAGPLSPSQRAQQDADEAELMLYRRRALNALLEDKLTAARRRDDALEAENAEALLRAFGSAGGDDAKCARRINIRRSSHISAQEPLSPAVSDGRQASGSSHGASAPAGRLQGGRPVSANTQRSSTASSTRFAQQAAVARERRGAKAAALDAFEAALDAAIEAHVKELEAYAARQAALLSRGDTGGGCGGGCGGASEADEGDASASGAVVLEFESGVCVALLGGNEEECGTVGGSTHGSPLWRPRSCDAAAPLAPPRNNDLTVVDCSGSSTNHSHGAGPVPSAPPPPPPPPPPPLLEDGVTCDADTGAQHRPSKAARRRRELLAAHARSDAATAAVQNALRRCEAQRTVADRRCASKEHRESREAAAAVVLQGALRRCFATERVQRLHDARTQACASRAREDAVEVASLRVQSVIRRCAARDAVRQRRQQTDRADAAAVLLLQCALRRRAACEAVVAARRSPETTPDAAGEPEELARGLVAVQTALRRRAAVEDVAAARRATSPVAPFLTS